MDSTVTTAIRVSTPLPASVILSQDVPGERPARPAPHGAAPPLPRIDDAKTTDLCARVLRADIAPAVASGLLADSLLYITPSAARGGPDAFGVLIEVGRATLAADVAACAYKFLHGGGTTADMRRIMQMCSGAPDTRFFAPAYVALFLAPSPASATFKLHAPDSDDALQQMGDTMLAVVGEATIGAFRAGETTRHHLTHIRAAISAVAWQLVVQGLRKHLPGAFGAPWTREILVSSPAKLLLAALHERRRDLTLSDVFTCRVVAAEGGGSYTATAEARKPLFNQIFPCVCWAAYSASGATREAARDAVLFEWLRILEICHEFSLSPAIAAAATAMQPRAADAAPFGAADLLPREEMSPDDKFVWRLAIHPIYLAQRLIEIAAAVMEETIVPSSSGAALIACSSGVTNIDGVGRGHAIVSWGVPACFRLTDTYYSQHAYAAAACRRAAAARAVCAALLAVADALGPMHCLPMALAAFLRGLPPASAVDANMWTATGVDRERYFRAVAEDDAAPWPWDVPVEKVLATLAQASSEPAAAVDAVFAFRGTDALDVRATIRGLAPAVYTQTAPSTWRREAPKAALTAHFLDTLDRHIGPGPVLDLLIARPIFTSRGRVTRVAEL